MRKLGFAAITGFRSLVHDVVDLVYPISCAACEAHIDEGRESLCPPCLQRVAAQAAEASCPMCAKPLAVVGDPCPWCEGKGEPNFERIARLATYGDPIRHLIYRMKYHRRWPLAEFFADQLLEQETVKTMLSESNCLIPVPLHRLREISRGFNQADVLARRLSAETDLEVVHPLIRVRNTETQTAVHSRAKREENLRHAFALVKPEPIEGRHVVLIDDVMTTGATLQSVARAIKPARPASISVIVIAVADPKGRDFEVM